MTNIATENGDYFSGGERYGIFAIFVCQICGARRVYGNGTPENEAAYIMCPREKENRQHKFHELMQRAKWNSVMPPSSRRNFSVLRAELGLPALEEED